MLVHVVATKVGSSYGVEVFRDKDKAKAQEAYYREVPNVMEFVQAGYTAFFFPFESPWDDMREIKRDIKARLPDLCKHVHKPMTYMSSDYCTAVTKVCRARKVCNGRSRR